MDLSIARNIRLGGGRQLQLNSPTDLTIRNNQYLADGSVNPTRVKPRDAGYGATTGALDMRTVHLQLRFQF